jgi:anaerobic ribonucleoside-triphosphate reductase activating protein
LKTKFPFSLSSALLRLFVYRGGFSAVAFPFIFWKKGWAMQIQIAQIHAPVYTDGPGKRVALYVQGCPLRCPGCQSPSLWARHGGSPREVADVVETLLAYDLPITIIGGEPLQQAPAVALLVRQLKAASRHIIVYTGYTYEELVQAPTAAVTDILSFADVLVDGRYDAAQDDAFVQYRGSRNQRPINLDATRATGTLTVLNWDEPELLVLEDGSIVAAEGLLEDGAHARMCGEVAA